MAIHAESDWPYPNPDRHAVPIGRRWSLEVRTCLSAAPVGRSLRPTLIVTSVLRYFPLLINVSLEGGSLESMPPGLQVIQCQKRLPTLEDGRSLY